MKNIFYCILEYIIMLIVCFIPFLLVELVVIPIFGLLAFLFYLEFGFIGVCIMYFGFDLFFITVLFILCKLKILE